MSTAIHAPSRRAVRLCGLIALAITLTACGDDESDPVTLRLLTPSDGQVLTRADDQNPSRAGVQLDVIGESSGLRPETPIELHIDGEAEGATARVGADGKITMRGVTLPPGEHTIHLVTSVGSVKSDDRQSYTLRVLVIESPEDGDELTEDANDDVEGFQVDVRAQGFALSGDGERELRVDGETVATASPDADGTVTFTDVTLAEGAHTLQARAGDIVSDNVEITVNPGGTIEPPPGCEGVGLLAPSAPGSGAIVLGGSACGSGGAVVSDVRVSVDQPDGTRVSLELNGDTVGTAQVEDGEAAFDGVELGEPSRNRLTLVVGETDCRVNTRDIVVDCAAPTCLIRSPQPVEHQGTLFLGAAQEATGGGFDVEVETSDDAAGETIALVIDGDEENALTIGAEASGGEVLAVFSGVALGEGARTISARCRDAIGNVVTTPTVELVVDTVACGVAITAPAAGAIYLPASDTTPGTAGVQIGAVAAVTGGDCVAVRSGLCPSGSLSGEFGAFDGSSPHAELLTLADGVTAQSYCVDVRDRAGNVGSDSAAFMFRQNAPMVLIESPATGTSFNAAGGGAYTADAVPETALCDAAFTVACEVGTMVELHRDDALGALLGSAPCVADASAPAGHTGRATLTVQISESLSATSATVVATQSFSAGGTSLVGVSAPVTLATDCQPPVVVETNTPCNLHASHQITDEEAASFAIALADSSADTVSAGLEFWIGADVTSPLGAPTGTQAGNVAGGSAITFSAIDLGGLGDIVVRVTLTDDFDNVAEYLCESEVVDELPQLTALTWPADGATYGPGDSECDPDGAGPLEYGIEIVVGIDTIENRAAALIVNGEATALTLTDTTIELCVAVPNNSENTPPGPTTIRVQATEVGGNGTDFIEREINVHTILITDPAPDQLIVSADLCDAGGGASGYLVVAAIDAIHLGEDYELVADGATLTGEVTGGTVQGCVPVTTGGERTFTARIAGTSIEHSVTATVVNDTPQIVSLDSPADGAAFGPGEGCNTGTPGTFGVLVEATLDQQANREADILVNGSVVVDGAPISSGATISSCVPVPDDQENGGAPSTVTVSLVSTLGSMTPVTAGADVSVDTLDITSPVASAVITDGDNCASSGFGVTVALAVDPMHLGRSYTITDGTEPATGVVASDVVTACVALGTGARTITASLDGTPISDSVAVERQSVAPMISAITAPSAGASFGPGEQTCDAGAGHYGIAFSATIDQETGRTATLYVNGVEHTGEVTISSTTVTACLPVPDNRDNANAASVLRLVLGETGGSRTDEATVSVNVDKLNITAPVAGEVINPTTDCDPTAGLGYPVSIAVDASLAGLPYVVAGGLADLTGTVSGAAITGCLAVAASSTSITVSITGTAITESVAITVFDGAGPTAPLTFTRSCPDSASPSYREGSITLTWGDLRALENFPGQLQGIALRCAHTPVPGDVGMREAWWTSATQVALPPGTTLDSTGVSLPFRVGEQRFCVLRGSDFASAQSPVTAGTEITCGFRHTVLHTATVANGQLGSASTSVGDVNGDGIDDMLVGGNGRAALFFGRTTAFSGAPDVLFTGVGNFGARVGALGDFNGDSLDDFAISHWTFNGNAGRLYVFYGRSSASPWPATVDLSAGCNADICFDHATANARLAGSIAGIGDMNGDGLQDLAVGAVTYDANGAAPAEGQLLLVQGRAPLSNACAGPADCPSNQECTANACVPTTTFWQQQIELPSGNWTNPAAGDPVEPRYSGFSMDGVPGSVLSFARAIAGVGAFDSTPGADLVVSAGGNGAVGGQLFFFSGRADATPGLDVITTAELGFRSSVGGAPSGTAFHSGLPVNSGVSITPYANIFDVPGGTAGAVDIIVRAPAAQGVFIYPGDTNFNPADRVELRGQNATDFGAGLGRGYHPALPGLTSDLDGDGRDEVAVGTTSPSSTPGAVYLFYGDVVPNQAGGALVQYTVASPIQPPASTGTQLRIVSTAGDLNGDGHTDFFVGDWQANGSAGELHLLY